VTFLKTQQKMAREKLTPLWDCYNDCEGTQKCLMEEDLDTLTKTLLENTIKHLEDEVGSLHSGVASLRYDDPVSRDWRHGYEQCRKDALNAIKYESGRQY